MHITVIRPASVHERSLHVAMSKPPIVRLSVRFCILHPVAILLLGVLF